MAKLITNDDTLRQFLPNVFATVKDEVSLFDKVKVDIDLAENWVIETFTSSKTFNTICGYVEDNPIRIITAKLIASEALRRAIPSLDLVLTPNGFGVVSNQNIAPASKERVDRLIGSLADYRDDCIANLLPELVGASQWLNSSQASFFGETLFPRPRHHRPSERQRLEVGALSLTSPQDTRHRSIACRGVFLTRTDGAVEKRGATEDAHGRPCSRHQRHSGASR